MPTILTVVSVSAAVLGTLLVFLTVGALWHRRPVKALLRLLLAATLLSLSVACGAVVVGIQGYRALTHEEVAATVDTVPLAPRSFRAEVRFADGRTESYVLAGDQLYVDARVLKWTPLANFFGLHTAYELDRIGGRYHDLDTEKNGERTVFALGRERPVNLFDLRRRYNLLAHFLDADYGSATFVEADERARFEIRVSTTGLLARRATLPQ